LGRCSCFWRGCQMSRMSLVGPTRLMTVVGANNLPGEHLGEFEIARYLWPFAVVAGVHQCGGHRRHDQRVGGGFRLEHAHVCDALALVIGLDAEIAETASKPGLGIVLAVRHTLRWADAAHVRSAEVWQNIGATED
jgi:hypothetical protein